MKINTLKSIALTSVLGVISPLVSVLPASAATVTWIGYGEDGDNAVTSPVNWLGGSVVSNGDTAVFPVSGNHQMIDMDSSTFTLVKIIFNGENTFSSSKSYELTGGDLTINEGIDAVMTGSGGDHQIKSNVTLGSNAAFVTSGSNSLSVGDTATTLDIGSNTLTLNPGGGTISLLGTITGSGNIVKSGTGKTMIMAKTSSFTGTVNASAGETVVNDNLGAAINLTGGTLKGTGTVGAVTMSAGAVAPGASPGILNTGNLAYTGGNFDVEIGGTEAGQYDQTNVTGTVDLGSATSLNVGLVNGFEPAVNNAFTIINNDGADAVNGTFLDLADGARFTIAGYTYQINYDAGDGNDVVLLVTGTPSAPDTGTGVLSSIYMTLFAAIATLGAAGYVYYSHKKAKN